MKTFLAAVELGIEAGAQLQQSRHSSPPYDAPRGGLQDPAQNLQQGALSGTVGADNAKGLALADRKIDAPQRPEILMKRPAAEPHRFLEAVNGAVVDLVELGDVLGEEQNR